MKIKSLKTKRKSLTLILAYCMFTISFISYGYNSNEIIVSNPMHMYLFGSLTIALTVYALTLKTSYIKYKGDVIILRDGKDKIELECDDIKRIDKVVLFEEENEELNVYLRFVEELDDGEALRDFEHYVKYSDFDPLDIIDFLEELSIDYYSLDFTNSNWRYEVI